MRKLECPKEKPEEVFRLCISHVRDLTLKIQLESCEKEIVSSYEDFKIKASKSLLHKILRKDNVIGIVSKKEMEKVYTDRMAKKGAPGRVIYDKLLAAPKHGRCPLCGQRTVSTLDHYLPKTLYPSLVVAPINLIPSCKDCNTGKLGSYPKSSEEETLHPYFDDIENERWLYADVLTTNPVSIRFFVSAHDAWSELLKNRVKYHFNSFGLSSLYSSHAAEELTNIQYVLNNLHKTAGPNGVKAHLIESSISYSKVNKNSWQSAMYEAASKSKWFFSGGFNEL